MTEKTFIELYQRQKESGLTVNEFCSNEVIAPSTFYNWQKKLRDRNRLPGFIPVVVSPAPDLSHTQPPVKSAAQEAYTPVFEIELPNKTKLRIKSELDISVLKTLIQLAD